MAVEQMRGCGYRVVGGLYLCGEGPSMHCDRLPYELELCPVCGSGVKFTRGWTWLDWYGYAGEHSVLNEGCKCGWLSGIPGICPVCHPALSTPLLARDKKVYGLLWVGESNYTPQIFIQEALVMGISKRIAAVPKNLKLGQTWVLLAHKKVIQNERAGIFYAFRPQSLELLVWESEAKPEYIEDLAKHNITAVIIPDGDEDHNPDTKTKVTDDDREEVGQLNKIALIRKSIGR